MGICVHGPVIVPGVEKAQDIFGAVRYRNFSDGSGLDMFLSNNIANLAFPPPARAQANVTWVENNPFLFSYNAQTGILTSTVNGVTINFQTLVNQSFDVVQIFIRDRSPEGSEVFVTNLTLNGTSLPGIFPGATNELQYDILCDLANEEGGFTLEGNLFLIGPQNPSQEASRFEILVADNYFTQLQ
ncbi:choice-of-anchor W domain-containing protein [Alteribacter aurantiacus]|uniref:choice-of-anchor W domain-containing protein n=1 Tax=Alteribacter aurantiacus TaxID=254410 RepID=UPI00041A67F5|nr:choice-of-anchor W domain-containing protein [Alteribacter aurantiacus]